MRWKTAVTILVFGAALTAYEAVGAPIDLAALAARAGAARIDAPRKVLAFYYPWYGNPEGPGGAGRWAHWSGVDKQRRKIASSTHWPALGPYDSHDPAVADKHCQWARRAGIDGWIVSWWGHGSFSDRALDIVLEASRRAGLDVTIYYETVPGAKTPQSAAVDLVRLLKRYADHPAWLRVGGKPVVFIYGRAVGQLGLIGWAKAIDLINRDYAPGAVILGDKFSTSAARVFDGVHTYNTAGRLRDKTPEEAAAWARQTYPGWVEMADRAGRISTLTVIPGYDDTKIRSPGLAVDRFGGRLYEVQWENAIEADPHWVLVTTFNEWHEGSEIEPSAEFGEKYLEITAKYAARFKALGRRTAHAVPDQPGGLSEAAKKRRLGRLDDLKIGLLPGGDVEPIWPLLTRRPAPAALTVEQTASLTGEDASRTPILLYTGAESYRRTARSPGDVDEGLLRYLRAGGCLAVLPSGPMPFHYDERGEAVGNASKLGLPLSVGGRGGGWETPPEGRELKFVVHREALPDLPASFPFPATGDLRWRPLVRSQLAAGDRVIPLIELQDSEGARYGLAAAYVEHRESAPRGAKLLYAWFGLFDSPIAEALACDLYGFLGGQLAPQRRLDGDGSL